MLFVCFGKTEGHCLATQLSVLPVVFLVTDGILQIMEVKFVILQIRKLGPRNVEHLTLNCTKLHCVAWCTA